MEKIRKGAGKLLSIILAALLIVSVSGVGKSGTVYAAEPVNYTQKAESIQLGVARSFAIYSSDYLKWSENGAMHSGYYGKVYKIKINQSGNLRILLERADEEYSGSWDFVIFKTSEANTCLIHSDTGSLNFNSSTNSYRATKDVSLAQGEYYIILYYYYMGTHTVSTPTNLTLTYISPIFSVSTISLNTNRYFMYPGQSQTLSATISPSNATNKAVFWKSDNDAVASVNNGVITAHKAGTAIITCTSVDGGASAECKVTVKNPVLNVGAKFKSGNATYTVTQGGSSPTVEYTSPASKSSKSISIPSTVELGGNVYRVTSIGDNACKNNKKLTSVTIGANIATIGKGSFMGCGKLTYVSISSTKITSMGANSFKGLSKKAVVRVPASRLAKYKKMLKKAKLPSKAKVVK